MNMTPGDSPGPVPNAATPAAPAPGPATPRFCNGCGAPWQPTWVTCPGCDRRRLAPNPAPPLAGWTRKVNSGLWLYFTFLAISVSGIIAVACDTSIVNVEIVFTLVSSVVVTIWCLCSRRDVVPPLARVPHVKWFAIAATGSVATFLIASGALALLTRFTGIPQLRLTAPFSAAGYGPAFLIFLIAVQPAIFEELAFRGVILGGLLHVLSPVEAVVVSAAMFMIIHLSIPSFPHLFVMGVALGYLRVASGSLYPGVLLHFAHNLYCVAWEYWSPIPAW